MAKERGATPTPRRNGGYYLECRKDAQCMCRMCEDSIHATLDLRPSNTLFTPLANTASPSSSSLTSKSMNGKENQWPFIHTPPPQKGSKRFGKSFTYSSANPVLEELNRPNRRTWKILAFQLSFLTLFLQLVGQWCMLGIYKPALTFEHAIKIGEDSMARNRLVDRLDFVKRKMSVLVPGKPVFNCTGPNSQWKLVEDGFLIHSSCNVYTSMAESVSVWGYPAKTSGILGRSIISRSFTVLAGNVLECKEGQIECIDHPTGSSWVLSEWSASVVFVDGNTWILQYKRSAILEGVMGSLSGVLHMAKCWLRLKFLKLKATLDTLLMKEALIRYAVTNKRSVPPT